ncbi:protein of unknown function UPF0005 [Alkalidesulfovibrio alkalitolerans DSM 16529]|uniref:Uncharacterized protein n=1 Tax=Alkalidesulfovibrio alkalitolerans DSM 16529 TaxID=1121439 RepID=S7UGY8_9BACT|nr:Bax inhibitor-1/YccA family protein [Alkalidesulfovibrio alkalitolerans]EPR33099.1 protein of unknown function UPF0005 [Alkalidesulfovibrio alkalitolerans DSM 16529]
MNRFETMRRAQAKPEVLNAFMRGVYTWMCGGLLTTAALALFTASSPALLQVIYGNPIMPWVVMLSPLVLVFVLSGMINRLSANAASGLFLLYSALMGLSLSFVFLAYSPAAISKAFFTAAGMFGAMSIYGYTTKKDLTSWGSFLFMGLIGVILASVVNIFLRSPALDFVVSGVGVLVFVGLTAYDTQRLKTMAETAPMDDALVMRRGVILGALTLYLDFINLFLMLLRFFGGNRD